MNSSALGLRVIRVTVSHSCSRKSGIRELRIAQRAAFTIVGIQHHANRTVDGHVQRENSSL